MLLSTTTVAGALGARSVVRNQEESLLEARAAEIGLVLDQAVTSIEGRLEALGAIARLTDADPAAFIEAAEPVLETSNFRAVALVDVAADPPTVVAVVGSGLSAGAPLSGTKAETVERAGLQLAFTEPFQGPVQRRLGMAIGAPLVPEGLAVYGENRVEEEPAEPRGPEDPFSELDVVLYTGTEADPDRRVLTTTTDLPLGGPVDRREIEIGADTWFMETAAIDPLVGGFTTRIHWVILGLGLVVTFVTVLMIEALRRRHEYALALVDERTAELVEADRLKDEFLDIAAHELRTPLTAVAGFAELLREGQASDPETRARLVERIYANARAMEQLTSKFLDLSRLRAGRVQLHLETVRLEEAVREAMMHAGETLDDHPVTVDVAHDLTAEADSEATGRILVNLLTNAAKFSDPGTPVTVSARPNDQEVEVSVSDQGPGVPEGEGERIFERFYRVGSLTDSVRGTGVGLAIVAKYVELQGGRVGVDSEPGKGSRFWFTLPMSPRSGPTS